MNRGCGYLQQGRAAGSIVKQLETQKWDFKEQGNDKSLDGGVSNKENTYPTYQVPWCTGVVKKRATPGEGCRTIIILRNYSPCFQVLSQLCISS